MYSAIFRWCFLFVLYISSLLNCKANPTLVYFNLTGHQLSIAGEIPLQNFLARGVSQMKNIDDENLFESKLRKRNMSSLTVLSPNGGENWFIGTVQTITWSSNGISNVNIDYSTNNGVSWNIIDINISASLGTYSWTIPNTASTQSRVRITDAFDTSVKDQSDNAFTISIAKPSLTLLVPNGGEVWQAGSSQQISWTRFKVTKVNIDYTTNNGMNWSHVAVNISASSGKYDWIIPGTPSTQCIVRISDASNQNVSDQSDSTFVISVPQSSIILLLPNGGEDWHVGTLNQITWSATNIANVNLDYTTNNGLGWNQIASNIPASSNSYDWTIPNTVSTQCKVKVSDASNTSVFDQSDTVFTISSSGILTLLSPNGGENWQVGSLQNITFISQNVPTIKIEYTTDSGANWLLLSSNASTTTGNYLWTIPNTTSTQCKVKISDVSDPLLLSNQSKNTFTISSYDSMKILIPNGGEVWTAGSSYNILWTTSIVSTIKIEYTTNNGNSWIAVADSVPTTGGSYNWIVPNTPSTTCKVRITDNNNASIKDESDSAFTINTTSSLILLSPNGGEQWGAGSKQTITWQSIGDTTLIISYSTNGGGTWNTVADNVLASQGKFDWNVPDTPSDSCLVSITVNTNTSISDSSDYYFSITASHSIVVLKPNGGEHLIVGKTYSIDWQSSGINNVTIDYSTNDGTNWISIVPATAASANNYSWSVPYFLSKLCLVRISDFNDAKIFDVSDSVFEIRNVGRITVTAPNGGEQLLTGSTRNILWQSSDVDRVRIDYSTDGGITWSAVVHSIINTGMYPWKIPATLSKQCIVKLTDVDDSTVFDMSDNLFWIVSTTGMRDQTLVDNPTSFYLGQNYPNPFTSSTTMRFSMPVGTLHATSLRIYDVFGREVLDLTKDVVGQSSLVISYSQLPMTGVYFYRLTFGSESQTRMMVMMR